jgi:hypothetical protein
MPEEDVFPSCDEVVIKLGQSTYLMSRAARQIADMITALYGEKLARTLFGERIEVHEAISRLRHDIARGAIEVRDTKVCLHDRCIDLVRLFKALDDYYKAFGMRMKALRELEVCRL